MSEKTKSTCVEGLGSLRGCLVDGDAEQLAQAKRVRRCSLTLSLSLQAAAVAALLLVPLFGRTERITLANWVPQPIYTRGGGGARSTRTDQRPPHSRLSMVIHSRAFWAPRDPPTLNSLHHGEAQEPIGLDSKWPPGIGNGDQDIPGGIPIGEGNKRPDAPPPVTTRPAEQRRIVITRLEPAMLLRRVEPVYPPLMRQVRRGGRVGLRAVIATDGTVQSLQAVNGDPGFYQSAIDAVRQWRYRPTILNGQPVEVETFITVIYQLQ